MEKKHLPLYGVGPFYVATCFVLTVVGIVLSRAGLLESGGVEYTPVRSLPFVIGIIFVFWLVGIILIVFGAYIWYAANFKNKIDDNIKNNELVTTGIYASVRNPIYSGISIILTGILLTEENYWLLILPFVFWIFMTVLMKCTEEKWLTDLYGEEYQAYCKRVNRCIPWFPKKEKNEEKEDNN
ncbi:MAG: isoprenylcysteine carboxylmethyltransferase family protein [Lachnospiraceae bacterium]|nr:isoprenylcysteine carboxylmethyltransferase family protein [Lachnospiraceae bacterium]